MELSFLVYWYCESFFEKFILFSLKITNKILVGCPFHCFYNDYILLNVWAFKSLWSCHHRGVCSRLGTFVDATRTLCWEHRATFSCSRACSPRTWSRPRTQSEPCRRRTRPDRGKLPRTPWQPRRNPKPLAFVDRCSDSGCIFSTDSRHYTDNPRWGDLRQFSRTTATRKPWKKFS